MSSYDWKEGGIHGKKEVRTGSWSGVREGELRSVLEINQGVAVLWGRQKAREHVESPRRLSKVLSHPPGCGISSQYSQNPQRGSPSHPAVSSEKVQTSRRAAGAVLRRDGVT